MSKNRIKITSPTIRTREHLDEVIGEIRELTIHRNGLQARLEYEHKAIDDKFGPDIAASNGGLEQLTEQVKAWAESNGAEFGGARTLVTTHGSLGWRTGQWQCGKLAGWIWARGKKTASGAKVVLDKLKEFTATKEFVRTAEEVDKEGLIAARGTLSAEQLGKVGVAIFQEEAFFVDPKLEKTENRQVA